MMPEALLEQVTFVSEEPHRCDSRFCWSEETLPPDLLTTFKDYAAVCRFGIARFIASGS